jgi:acyl-CoA synthetase (AMP-forming)/AMP-acid ligase II/thioesterase domain-containing protein/acyl carrier protein
MTTTANAGRLHHSLEASIRTHATLRAEAPALLAPGRTPCTYQQLAAHLDRLGAALAEWLPADNPVIAVAAANGPDTVTAILAAMSGGICAPFDPSRPPAEIDAFLADIKPAIVLADEAAIFRHRDAFDRYGIGVARMVLVPSAPAGVFEARLEAPDRRSERAPAYDADVVLLLRTSGTTAFSKIIPHTMPRIMHVSTTIAGAQDLQPADRCFNTMPLYHAYAITSVLGPSLVAGASVICPTNIGAAALVGGLRNYKPTWYTAAPPTHRDVLAYMRREARPLDRSLRFSRTLGAPIDAQLINDLEAFLGAPVFDGYGSTEAPSSTYNLPSSNRPGSVGRAVGCEIAIFDGEVAIRGANVAPAYGDRTPIADPITGWYHTGDTGHIDADGFLYITGRLNELINVGGEKVSPVHVEEVLNAHPAVADAAVFPLPHPTLGQHVAAAVVPRANATVTEQDLIEHAALLLPRAAVPNVVHLVASIPRDGTGKARRLELTEAFARDARVAQLAALHDDDALLQALTRIWQEVLEYAPVALDENFFAAGGDSLRAIHVMTRIEAELGVTMSTDTLLFAPTIQQLAKAVRARAVLAQTNTTYRNRIVALRSTGSRPPLFFYDSDVDGGGLYARFLKAALDLEQPIYLVRPNGALGDAIPESIDAMAAADAAMIATAVPSQTYRLAGFCAGGVVAFEVARHLENAGSTVDVVALIASSAPNALLEPLWAWTSRVCGFLSQRNHVRVYRTLRSLANAIRSRSYPAEIINAIYALRHPFVPETPAGRIYTDRLLRHFPKPTARSIDLIWPDDDRPIVAGDPYMGWRHVARVRRHSVAGDHTTVLTEHLDELGAMLRRIFDGGVLE